MIILYTSEIALIILLAIFALISAGSAWYWRRKARTSYQRGVNDGLELGRQRLDQEKSISRRNGYDAGWHAAHRVFENSGEKVSTL